MTLNIQWYPGHMDKALRDMREALKRVDLVVEVLDARAPAASRNPDLSKLLQHKDRLVLLAKADLADPRVTEAWRAHFQAAGEDCVDASLLNRRDVEKIRRALLAAGAERLERARAKGYKTKALRLLVAGIPNSGKSTLINALAGKKSLATENRPGITRRLFWLRAGRELELLDSPGVLWPKLASDAERFALAATGAVPDDLIPLEAVARMLFRVLADRYPEALEARYGSLSFSEAARRRGSLLREGEVDVARFARTLLDEFRKGTIGRLSLERP